VFHCSRSRFGNLERGGFAVSGVMKLRLQLPDLSIRLQDIPDSNGGKDVDATFQPWRYRQYVTLKRSYATTSPNDVTTQKIDTDSSSVN
jgi:hypothetical protein